MPYEPANTAAACSWVGLFATVWSARNAVRTTDSHHDTTAARRRRPSSNTASSGDTYSSDTSQSSTDDRSNWVPVDLFPSTTSPKARSRFDDTVALPIDTPRRLETTICTVGRRLRAMPEIHELGHRSISYRAQLQRIQGDAVQARARLAAGTYGTCIQCSSPISLTTLSEKPWTQVCIYCALDI